MGDVIENNHRRKVPAKYQHKLNFLLKKSYVLRVSNALVRFLRKKSTPTGSSHKNEVLSEYTRRIGNGKLPTAKDHGNFWNYKHESTMFTTTYQALLKGLDSYEII